MKWSSVSLTHSENELLGLDFAKISASTTLGQFVQFAAKTANSAAAFVIVRCDGELMAAHYTGATSVPSLPMRELVTKSTATVDGPLSSVLLHATQGRSLLATVAVRKRDLFLGVLVICDPHPGSLSGSQQYLLQAIALELADQLDPSRTGEISSEISSANGTAWHGSPLEQRLRLLESVVVHANDSVLITEAEPIDLPGPRIQYVNPAFTRTTGYTLEDAIGNTPRMLQGPLSGAEPRERIRAALKAWLPVEVELLNYRKDGSTFWVELSISPVCDEKGWYTHWISVQRDVTERKAREEATARMLVTSLQNEALTQEIQERKLVEAKLSHTAFHDSLTDLHNRLYFMETLGIALKRAQTRLDYRAAVAYVDLDGFKAINDTLGHRVGDLLLQEIARRLQRCARAQDTLARLGGDEFILLIDDQRNMQQALEVANRMLTAVQAPVMLAGMELQVTASIGLCGLNADSVQAEDILRDADTAMYRAKRQGGTQCVIYDQSMHESSLAALKMKLQLKEAVEGHQFELYYQPLVNLADSSIHGIEALVRWHHPSRGLLGPGEFIQLAEETGLIVTLGSWVLHRACSDFQILQHASQRKLLLTVNVSSRQLDESGFLKDLSSALQESGIAPERLQLEITESILMKDAERIGALFAEIRALGVKIAFDDFGTGYSSLSYLERYPIDTLKIDQSFVQHMEHGSANADIVKMVIKLADAIGMSVSAEGVEHPRQAEALIEYGCRLVQGYLYSRPVPLEVVVVMLERGIINPEHLPELPLAAI